MKVLYSAVVAAIILCLGFLYSSSHAQGTPDLPAQQWYTQVTSSECISGTMCGNACGARCQSTTFQVPTTGQYILYASVKCAYTHCGHCQSCANILEGNVNRAHVISHCGDEAPCTGDNSGSPPTLTAGVTYTLCVCLFPCPSESNECTVCGTSGCEAIACVTAAFGGGGCGN